MLQGNLLLLNVYHGPVVNAAFAVSLQVFSAFIALGNNVIFAVRPQMVMAYSDGRYDRLNYLFTRSSPAVWALCRSSWLCHGCCVFGWATPMCSPCISAN